ncbi:MAG: serine/threonine protein kinase [Planctomycetota bacterium]|nr:MAG: serine/threonine protein kinase [Planctomycetota bacterium]
MARDQLLGQHLGQYLLRSRLGEGGMGVVYRAWDERGQRDVAVKVLTHHSSKREARQRLMTRFLREGQAAASVTHPNVVTIYESGIHEQTAFLAMELVNGASLGQVLDESHIIEADKVAKIGAAIARGMAAIHTQGIVHRDIKPDNILLGRDGSVKIADLGLAKLIDDDEVERLTASGIVIGTPLYVAPEAIRNAHHVGPSADIYSFGATLYHLLCGHPPFIGDSPYELMRAHLDDRPRPLHEVNPAVPLWLSRVVHACLQKKPEHRPSAKALALSLAHQHDLAAGQRRSLVAAIIGAVLVVGTVVAAITWRMTHIPESAAAATDSEQSIQVHSRYNSLYWRSESAADGSWQALTGDTPVITHDPQFPLQIRSIVAGIFLEWEGLVDNDASALASITPDLRPRSTRAVYHDFPGSGLIMIAGVATAHSSEVAFSFQGAYPVVLWGDRVIRETTMRVGPNQATADDWRVVQWPSPEHYFSTTTPSAWGTIPDRDDLPPHHWVSGQELTLVIDESLTERLGTHESAQPARNLSTRQVRAFLERSRRHGVVLPNREQARRLQQVLGVGMWFGSSERLYYMGAPSPEQAYLIMVPDDQ